VSKEMVARITDRVLEEMTDWPVRPLDEIYAAVSVEAIVVNVRDGQVANRPVYAAIGVSPRGTARAGAVGWPGRRGSEVLHERAHRSAQPRVRGRVLRRLRRIEGSR
jgi:hypothetical protein